MAAKTLLMKRLLNVFAAVLLFLNGSTALFGGYNLMAHPDGSTIQLSLHWLKYSPFHDYLIPGIILFIANGICSSVTFIALLLKYRYYPWLVIAQGAMLIGWISVQMILMQTTYYFHYIFGVIGILLVVLGVTLFLNPKTS